MHRLLIAAALIAATAFLEMRAAPLRGRDDPDLSAFDCTEVTQSRLLKRVCYDAEHRTLLAEIDGRYYAHCNIDDTAVDDLLQADSIAAYYIAEIRAGHKCKAGDLPPDIARVIARTGAIR